jgi:hypothetical protein
LASNEHGEAKSLGVLFIKERTKSPVAAQNLLSTPVAPIVLNNQITSPIRIRDASVTKLEPLLEESENSDGVHSDKDNSTLNDNNSNKNSFNYELILIPLPNELSLIEGDDLKLVSQVDGKFYLFYLI